MSFKDKTNLVGLEITGLSLRSNSDGSTNSILPINGSDGSILGYEKYGEIKNPTCEYAIVGSTLLSNIDLGKCYNGQYALNSITVSTGAGQEPTFSATAVQIEEDAEQTVCTYKCPEITVTPARHALTFDAFTYTESISCVLQNSDITIECDISPATINGEPVASDSTGGVATVNVTFWTDSDSVAPTIELAEGWMMTTNWAMTGGDSTMPSWSATLSKPLTATQQS